MRVTIEHREETKGLTGSRKDCYVDCRVEFSEEERAIVRARDLYRDGFTIRTSTPIPTKSSFLSTIIMRLAGPLMIVGGIIYSIVESVGHSNTNMGGPIAVFGVIIFIVGWVRGRREDKRFENNEQTITIKQLLNHPTFTVHAWNPGLAKGFEDEIRDHLASLKNLISSSAQLQAKQTFEL